jgi:hypothetical protein
MHVQVVAVHGRIVHGGEGDVALLGADLGAVAVDARRGGHVEPLGGADEIGVVDLDEAGSSSPVEGGAGGAVRLVADDEVEGREPVQVLGAADDLDAVVGGEDDADVVGIVALGDLAGEAAGIGGGRVAQLVAKVSTMSSSALRFLPTSLSEQTAKLCSGMRLSCVHSVSVCDNSDRLGTRNSTRPPGPA